TLFTTGCATIGGNSGQCYILQEGGAYSSASSWFQPKSTSSTVARVYDPQRDSGVTTTRMGNPTDLIRKPVEEELRKAPVTGIPRRNAEPEQDPEAGPQLEALRPSVPSPVVPAPLPGEAKPETEESKSATETTQAESTQAATKLATVQMTVTAEPMRYVGSPIEYRLSIRNASPHAADKVEVLCEFDPGLNLPGKSERAAVQKLGELEAGETREIDLTLTAAAPGRKTCRFSIKGDNLAPVETISKAVEIRPRKLTIELSGPGRGQAGQKIYFDLTLHNPSTETLRNLDVQLKSGKEFTPIFAEGQPQTNPDGWRWKIPELKPDQRVKYQLVLTCGKVMDNATLAIEGTESGVSLDRVDANLQIVASAGTTPPASPPQDKNLAPPKLVPPDVELGEPQAP
ncbi:MAG: hypothetical protein U0903_22720, partial [Planctomycetales bacterium]